MRRELALKRCGECGAWHSTSFTNCRNCRARKVRTLCRALLVLCAIVAPFLLMGVWVMLEPD
jgi:hypothetical protein